MDIARNLADSTRNLVDTARDLTTSTPDPERAYRLRSDEHVPDGIRRVARGQLLDARDHLENPPARKLGEAVHETRKHTKRVRACVRLARDTIGEDVYRRENTALRTAARRISAPRDAQVLLETLDALTERFADELASGTTSRLRARLDEEGKTALAALADGNGTIAATRAELDAVLARTPTWAFEHDGFDALSPGLRRIYRRGRDARRAAHTDPSAENLHEWRKRVKDLWHATEIVGAARPKQLERVARRAHKLSSVLGDHHDLQVLRAYVESHPQCFTEETSRQALLALIDRRSRRLGEKALRRSGKLYAGKPKRFVREIERGWRTRATAAPKPTAG